VKTLIYQEVQEGTTYSLFGRDYGNLTVYDIELASPHSVESILSVTTDCQTAMLLLELTIRHLVHPYDLVHTNTLA
jgi:hypothetical protein